MKPTLTQTKKALMLKMAGYIVSGWLSQLNLATHGRWPAVCPGESLSVNLLGNVEKVPSLDSPSYLCAYFYMKGMACLNITKLSKTLYVLSDYEKVFPLSRGSGTTEKVTRRGG